MLKSRLKLFCVNQGQASCRFLGVAGFLLESLSLMPMLSVFLFVRLWSTLFLTVVPNSGSLCVLPFVCKTPSVHKNNKSFFKAVFLPRDTTLNFFYELSHCTDFCALFLKNFAELFYLSWFMFLILFKHTAFSSHSTPPSFSQDISIL